MAEQTVFHLPDLGEGLTEAEIVAWHVAVGDEVHVDQPVIEVETAKATVEVPIPVAGTVAALHGQPGDVVAVGAPLVSVSSDVPAPSDVPVSSDVPVASAPGTYEESDDSGRVLVGYGTNNSSGTRRRYRRTSVSTASSSRTVAVVSPLVRRLARESGLDLSSVHGSGPSGLILRRDIERAAARPVAGDATAQRIPITGVRKAMADKLSRSRREIPEATIWVDVDASALLDARATVNARRPEEPVGLLALVAKFAMLGLARYPELNGRIEGDELVLPSEVGLGVATQTERGLLVPVVPNAQAMSVRHLSAELAHRIADARSGSITPEQLRGGTFTVNNYGIFGVDGSAAIINQPEVAILGIGRIIDRPWVVDGTLVVRKVTELTLAFDHRACDGATAGGFLRFVADCIESPVSVLGDL